MKPPIKQKPIAPPPLDKKEPTAVKVEIVNKRNWLDNAVSYSAAVIAIVSLFVALWQAYIGRKHNYIQVRPLLSIKESFNANLEPFGIIYDNNGFGPAIVTDCYMYINDTIVSKMDGDWWTPTKKAAGYAIPIPVTYEVIKEGFIIEPNVPKPLLTWRDYPGLPDSTASKNAFYDIAKTKIGFQISFQSIYGEEEWRVIYSHGSQKMDHKKAGTKTLHE